MAESFHGRRTAVLRAVATLAIVASPCALRAQGGALLEGIADAEFWSTDRGSNLLTRNLGRPAVLGRIQLWGAAEPWAGVFVYAMGEAAAGSAQNDIGRIDADLDQFGVRYVRSAALVVDLGKLPSPLGTFAARRFSTRNPLIGEPGGYPETYPVGAQLSGTLARFDYRVAVVTLPVSDPLYVPAPGTAPRPAVGAGFTPFTGLRLGASATWGPYLNASLSAPLLLNQPWQHYHQRVVALDLAFSRRHLDVHAEWARGSYDVPGFADPFSGETWYIEAKHALGPRVFVAARAETNNYPFIRPAGAATWFGGVTRYDDGELGVGYRLTASLVSKLTYRADRWHLTPRQAAFLGRGGHALAFQLSQSFDVLSMLSRTR